MSLLLGKCRSARPMHGHAVCPASRMAGMDLTTFLILSGIAAVGGFMRGFAGSATTMFMVPLFSLILAPAEAVLLGVLLDIVATAPLVPRALRQAHLPSVAPLLAGGELVIPLGAYLLVSLPVATMRIAIAMTVIFCALLLLSGWTYKGPKTPLLSFAVGAFAGTLGSATGIGGPPIMVYFLATGAAAKEVRANLNVYSIVRMSLSGAMIAYAGSFGPAILVKTGLLLPAMLAATWVGTRAFRVVSERVFRRALLVVLIALGVWLVVRTAAGA